MKNLTVKLAVALGTGLAFIANSQVVLADSIEVEQVSNTPYGTVINLDSETALVDSEVIMIAIAVFALAMGLLVMSKVFNPDNFVLSSK